MTRYVKEAPFVNKGYLVFRQTKMMLKRVTGARTKPPRKKQLDHKTKKKHDN